MSIKCDLIAMERDAGYSLRPWELLNGAGATARGSGEPFEQFAGKVTDSAYRIAEAMMKQGRRLKKDTTAT